MNDPLPVRIAGLVQADYIDSLRLNPGDRLPGIRELCLIYNVSSTTIVNALSVLAAQGLVVKMHGKGIFLTERAEDNTQKHSSQIGFIMPAALTVGVTMPLYNGIEAACRKRGWNLVVTSADYDYETEQRQVARLRETGCLGVIVNPVTRTHALLADDYLRTTFRDFPLVLVDIAYPEQGRTQVVFDNLRAGYDMTRFLIEEGHERIAFVDAAFPDSQEAPLHRSNMDRRRGYEMAMQEAGLIPEPHGSWPMRLLIQEHVDEALGMLQRWRDDPDHPTAIISLHDITALDLLHVAHDLEISVPGELRITGFDNLPLSNTGRSLFPTTNPDFFRAGEVAVDLLEREIRGQASMPVTYMLPVPLIIPGTAQTAPRSHARTQAVS